MLDRHKFLSDLLHGILTKKYTEPIKAGMPHKQQLIYALEYYPNEASRVIKALTSAKDFRGEAATSLEQADSAIQKYGNDLHDRMVDSYVADQTLLTSLEDIVNGAIAKLSSGGDGFLMAATIALDSTSAAQLGLDIPEDVIALLATGVVAAAIAGTIDGAKFDIEAVLNTWIGVQQQLAGAAAILLLPGITVHPMAKPAVPSQTQLPGWTKWDKMTHAEQAAIEAAFKDLLKAGMPGDVILYLIGIFGAASHAQIAAMLRCLFKKGYFNPQPYMARRDDQITSQFKKAWNAVSQHLTPNDLEGAWKDEHNIPSGVNHIDEVVTNWGSLDNLILLLDKKLGDPNLPANLKQIYQTMRDACQKMIDYVNSKVYRNNIPTSWPEQGFGPFVRDILKSTGCINATPATYPAI